MSVDGVIGSRCCAPRCASGLSLADLSGPVPGLP